LNIIFLFRVEENKNEEKDDAFYVEKLEMEGGDDIFQELQRDQGSYFIQSNPSYSC
jgi:hypothetical protein